MSLFPSNNLTGVDIGAHSLKVVSLKGAKGSYTLCAAAYQALPAGAAEGGDGLSSFMASALRAQRLATRFAATVISGHALIFRHLYLPPMPEKDLREAVKWEIRKETGIPTEELVSDFVRASGAGAKGSEGVNSLFTFSAKKADIMKKIELLSAGGLDARVVDVVPTALLAAFDMNNAWEDGANYAMLDIGTQKSTLAIFRDKRLSFAREIAAGGASFTSAIVKAAAMDPARADEFKSASGVLSRGQSDRAAAEALSSSLIGFCSEIARSFDYYEAQFREGKVGKLFLSGASARMPGIEDFIRDVINIPTFADDPFRGVKVHEGPDGSALKGIAPCLSVAVGLATRRPE